MTDTAGNTDTSTSSMETELTLDDYLSTLRRRGRLLWWVVATVVLIGVLIAFRVPPMYASSGILLADQPAVPEHVVRSTVPEDPDDRVRIITQRVLTRENLARIIAEKHLYAPLDPKSPDALDQFSAHVALAAEDPDILENLLGPSKSSDSMAFSLTFSNESAPVARDVAKGLVALYLQENQRARREQAEETTQFLTQESARLEGEIEMREARLAKFKREHFGGLPEDVDHQLFDRAQRDLEIADQDIRSLRERRDSAASALAQLSPNATVVDENGQTILGPQERETMLERRYAQLTAIYSADHPDVLKVKRELAALRAGGAAPSSDERALRAELSQREDELAAARTKYSADHPDVQRLEKAVEGLRAALARPPTIARTVREPDNPQYIERQLQLKNTEADLSAALARRRDLAGKLAELERHATSAPEVERELATLNRGYEQLLQQYDDIQSKISEAQMSANLESQGRGDRFTVLQAPQLPSSPEYPNRIAVLLLTVIIAFALGTGAVAVAERCDTTVRHPRDVSEHFGAPPLVAIPVVFNQEDVRRQSRRRFATVGLSCLWVGTIIYLFMTPV